MIDLNNPHVRKEVAVWYVDSLNLPIIPLCSSSHHKMSEAHKKSCTCPGKAPVLKSWTDKKTTTKKEAEYWFDSNPEFNVGCILGDTGKWNIVGVDIDGPGGEELLLDASRGVIPPTWEFNTSRGRRLLYLLPQGVISKKFKQERGPDELALITSGQQTVLPPSKHASGVLYQWKEGCSPLDIDITDAPIWILNRVVVFDQSAQGAELSDLTGFGERANSPPVTDQEWHKDADQGERNNHLAKLAGSLIARRNIPKDQVLLFLKAWNEEHCKPPLPVSEIEKMVGAIYLSEQMKQAKREKKSSRKTIMPLETAKAFHFSLREKGISLLYINSRGCFYRCDDAIGPWVRYEELFLQKELREYLISIEPSWGNTTNVNEVTNALKEAASDEENDDIFDTGLHPDLDHVYLRNGILDWKSGKLTPWQTNSFCTIQLPAEWRPEAVNSDAFVTWNEILEDWIPDAQTRMFLQEYIGYCLIPDCSFRTAVFLYGGGSNGKSLFIDAISPLFGQHINFTSLQRIADRFETAALVDKLINICADIDSTYLPETSVLKSLIAGDMIRGEYKFGKSFHFSPTARLLFSANSLPRAADKSEGWYSRWRFVEFPRQFKVDPSFKRDFLNAMHDPEALGAILCWAVAGLRRLYINGEFTHSNVMENAKKEYRNENDSVTGFIDAALTKVPQTGRDTLLVTSSLYHVYRTWCAVSGFKPVNQIEFVKRGRAVGLVKANRPVSGRQANCFIGVKLEGPEADAYDLLGEYQLQESLQRQT